MKILIVDDDRRVGQYLVDSLTPRGHDVLAATGGGEGVALFKSSSPDLVVVDLKMQGLDTMRTPRCRWAPTSSAWWRRGT